MCYTRRKGNGENDIKTLRLGRWKMYRGRGGQISVLDFTMSGTFNLDSENRWIKRSDSVPWDKAEQKYTHMFKKNGRPAKDIRIAMGSLLIQEFMGLSDEETLLAITENPYLQYFIGLPEFTNKPPFDPSLMVWFRKRLSKKFLSEINEEMCKEAAKSQEVTPPADDDDLPHGGTMIVDASCAPADIKYPTDTGLLAEAIEKTDDMIDTMQAPLKGREPRPRTYRKKSRRLFTGFIKQRKPTAKAIRKCRGKQLNYLKRNLHYVEQMCQNGGKLTKRQEKLLPTIQKLYNQQDEMHQNRTNRVDDRIVSLSQPHIRPIVRGKAGAPVEFGAKVNMSVVGGYTFLNEINYNAFNESELLDNAIIDYLMCFDMLPERILVDQIYVTRDNRKLCKELGIKLSGKPLGRPPKNPVALTDRPIPGERNEVEGKFGTLKTRYGWNRIMARLPETGESLISIAVLAMNLAKRAKSLLRLILQRLFVSFVSAHVVY